MSSLTTNLKLVKPELQDNITPTIFADNFDKIDAALEGVSGGALSLEEIEASTNLDGKIPSAAALKEVNNSLIADNSQQFKFGYQDEKYGYWVKEADTDVFVPFNKTQAVKGEFTSPTINNSIDIECGFVPTAISIRQKTNGNLISILYDIRNTPKMVSGSNLGSIGETNNIISFVDGLKGFRFTSKSSASSSKEYTYIALE